MTNEELIGLAKGDVNYWTSLWAKGASSPVVVPDGRCIEVAGLLSDLAERLSVTLAALKSIEWTDLVYYDSGPKAERSCPDCGSLESKGHHPECLIGAALALVTQG